MLRRLLVVAFFVLLFAAGFALADGTGRLGVTQDAPATVTLGDGLTYTLDVTRPSDPVMTDVEYGITLMDTLPAGVTADSVSSDCSGTTTIECAIPDLFPGGSREETIAVTPPAAGTLTNVANVSGTYEGTTDTDSSTGTVVVEGTGTTATTTAPTTTAAPPPHPSPPPPPESVPADLSVSLAASQSPANVGRVVAYTATVANAGPGTAVDVGLDLTAPANADLHSLDTSQGTCSGTPPLTCSLGSLPPHASATVTLDVVPSAVGTIVASASGTEKNEDPASGNDAATLTLPVAVAPTVTSLVPDVGSALGGTTVVVHGTGFGDATEVLFGQTEATHFTIDSPTQITAVSPAGPDGSTHVEVVTPEGENFADSSSLFSYFAGPSIRFVTPMQVAAEGGSTAYVEGVALEHVTTLAVDGRSVRFTQAGSTSDGDELLEFTAPPGHGTAAVTVTDPQGSSSAAFSYYEHADVYSISPGEGRDSGGYVATISGDNFQPGAVAHFGAAAATPTKLSAHSMTVTVPPGTGVVDVTVTNRGSAPSPTHATFVYDSSPCTPQGGCAFQAWAETDGTGSFSAQAKEPVTAARSDIEPDARSSCYVDQSYRCAAAKGPVSAKISLPIGSGAAVDGLATADPYTAELNVGASVAAGTGQSGSATGNGQVYAANSWLLSPQPTTAVKLALVVHISVDTDVAPVSADGDGTEVSATWDAGIDAVRGATGGAEANGTYSATVAAGDSGGYSVAVVDTETLNGKQLAAPAAQIVIPFTASASSWNELESTFHIQVHAITKGCATSCSARAHVVIDPVLVALTPGYSVAAKAPARLSATPLLRSVPAVATAGERVTVSGAGFGTGHGTVLLRAPGSARAVAIRPSVWRSGRVVFRLPRRLPTGRAWLTVRLKHGRTTNALPLGIVRRTKTTRPKRD